VWNSLRSSGADAPPGSAVLVPQECFSEWAVEYRVSSAAPPRWKFSMMSISPHLGHPTAPMSAPRVQKAGHVPSTPGTRSLASHEPYRRSTLPRVVMRPDEMAPPAVRVATMCSRPPETYRLAVEST